MVLLSSLNSILELTGVSATPDTFHGEKLLVRLITILTVDF